MIFSRYEFDWDPAKAARNLTKHLGRGDDVMKDEYDFSHAQRGKFYREDAELVPPVHLEPEVMKYLQARAQAHGTSLTASL